MEGIVIRPAVVADAEPILELINGLAADQIMLPRSPVSVIENLRDFVVAEVDGAFAGCGALHLVWTDMAEIRSIAVAPESQKLGLGRRMADALIADAERLGVAKLFAFTYVPGFFEKLDFAVSDHASLPHKVFSDCMNCPKFNACDEIAMVRMLAPVTDSHERGPLSLPRSGMLPSSSSLPRPVGRSTP